MLSEKTRKATDKKSDSDSSVDQLINIAEKL